MRAFLGPILSCMTFTDLQRSKRERTGNVRRTWHVKTECGRDNFFLQIFLCYSHFTIDYTVSNMEGTIT